MSFSIEKLKQLTLDKEANFADCINYFLDMAEDSKFITEGSPLVNIPEFFKMLLHPVSEFFRNEIDVSSFFLIKINKYNLVHGTVRLCNHSLVMLYYFEDVKSGIACAGKFGEDKTHYFRITLKVSGAQTSNFIH